MIRKAFLTLFMLIGMVLSASCSANQTSPTPEPSMPNPASVYCEQNGGRIALRQVASGGVAGVCVFPDGSECDEWAYFRGECKPGNTPVTPEPTASPIKLTAKDAGSTQSIREGDTLEIALEGNPSTGYLWGVAPDSGTLLAQQGEGEFKSNSSALGSGGIVTLRFKAVQRGEAEFKLIYHRTFEPDVPPTQTFAIRLVVDK